MNKVELLSPNWDDVVVYYADIGNLPKSRAEQFLLEIHKNLKSVFPSNKILVIPQREYPNSLYFSEKNHKNCDKFCDEYFDGTNTNIFRAVLKMSSWWDIYGKELYSKKEFV